MAQPDSGQANNTLKERRRDCEIPWEKDRAYRPVNAVKCGAGNFKVWGICFNQLDYGYRNWAAAVAGNLVGTLCDNCHRDSET
jgi:hypothetical protein